MIDTSIQVLLGTVAIILGIATLIGRSIAKNASTSREKRAAADLRARTHAWWWMVPLMVGCLALERPGIIGFFAGVSFLALRELVTLLPSRRADHTTLVLAFFVAVPVQYGLIWTEWYGMFAVFIPVWALVLVSIRLALKGDSTHFLRRVAAIQYALMVGIYCLSHAPALLMLRVPGFDGQEYKLIVFLVVVTQSSDVLQFIWGKLLGRTPLMPTLSPNKTVEGLVGGVLSATGVGALMTPLTPFTVQETAGLAFMVASAGWLGGLVMSAIKRDAGIKDYGSLIGGHGGMLDRADSMIFASPVLFHVVRWAYSAV